MTRQRLIPCAVLLAGLLLLGWSYGDVLLSIVNKWSGDAAFSHGYLIVPISVWLAWRKRRELAAVDFTPSWLGLVALILCTTAWIVARGSGVLVLEQMAVVAMVPAFVLAVLGLAATRVLMFPLAFLLFAVPFGRGIVPGLMQFTADIATWGLQLTGIPVLRSHMFISIPAGSFEVARACSGLNYFITSLVLGVLYAHINFRSTFKRIACVAAFIVIPIVLNGLRVYFTILVSHLTDMRFGPGTEHVTFGRIFFVVMMLLLFWVGRRWHEEIPAIESKPIEQIDGGNRSAAAWILVPAAMLLIVVGPMFLEASIANAKERLADQDALLRMPKSAEGWQGPGDAKGRWRPQYLGGLAERQVVYSSPQAGEVDVFVSVYGLGTSLGAEMVSYNNVIDSEERGSLAADRAVVLPLGDGQAIQARELVVREAGGERLVWYWFVVGTRPVTSPFAAKALEAVAFITRNAASERIITLSTPNDAEARGRLGAFATAHQSCIAAAFSGEACSV